jgi:hypothetical protein
VPVARLHTWIDVHFDVSTCTAADVPEVPVQDDWAIDRVAILATDRDLARFLSSLVNLRETHLRARPR